MLHFWVISDMAECGTQEQCRQWAAEQKACLDDFPFMDYDYKCHLIPPIPWKDGTDKDVSIRMSAVRDVYHAIANHLQSAIEEAKPTDRFVAVLDARLYCGLGTLPSLQSVQGLLILAFPEVLWVPVFKNGENEARKWLHTALEMVAGGFNPLFDGTGVRGELIRKRNPNSTYPYHRKDVAVTIDEERHYAELTAYTAFRFGYRTYPVSTARLARQVLGVESKSELPSLAGADVSSDSSVIVFEDGDIQFPDCNQENNSTHNFGCKRNERWPLLTKANLRVLTTASGEDEIIAEGKTAKAWFRDANVKDLCRGKTDEVRIVLEKVRRRAFNLFAGGMGEVWVWNAIKSSAIAGLLIWILICRPILLVPALFLVFVAFGLFRNAIVGGMSFLFGHHGRIRRFYKIRSQWRFYPKLYANHCPRREIQREGGRYWCFVRKPLGGIFGLRNQCGLPNGREFGGQLNAETVKKSYKNALKGHAPTETGADVEVSGHSAYGMTLDIATGLIGRVRAMKNKDDEMGIEEGIHAAVLATCAYELLSHKTPALSIEALALRHYFEVLVECQFHGVRASLDMEDRLIDIHNSMSQICRAADGTVREDMFANGMATICDNLADLLRSRGRFSEAAFMTRRARYMHRLLLPSFWRSFFAYPEWVLRAPWHFAISFAAVVVAFCMYWAVRVDSDGNAPLTLAKTWEILVCDEPNLSLPGNDKEAQFVAIREPFPTNAYDIASWEYEVWSAKVARDAIQRKENPDKGPDKNRASSPRPKISEEDYSFFAHTMRQIALLHLAFIGISFWDLMQRK